MFTSFPLGYFKHLAINQFRRPDVFWPMSGDQQAPAPIPSPKKRGTRSLSTSIRWQPAMGLPSVGAKPGISSSEEENRRGGRAPCGCLILLPHSHTVRHQFHCQLVLPMSPLQQPNCSYPASQNIWWVGWYFFFNCIWKLRGWGSLKNKLERWHSDCRMLEITIFFGKHGQLAHLTRINFWPPDLRESEFQKMQLCTMCTELLQFSCAYNWVIMYAKV